MDVDKALEVSTLAVLIALALLVLGSFVIVVVMEPLWVLAFISGAVILWLFAWAALEVAERRFGRDD